MRVPIDLAESLLWYPSEKTDDVVDPELTRQSPQLLFHDVHVICEAEHDVVSGPELNDRPEKEVDTLPRDQLSHAEQLPGPVARWRRPGERKDLRVDSVRNDRDLCAGEAVAPTERIGLIRPERNDPVCAGHNER